MRSMEYGGVEEGWAMCKKEPSTCTDSLITQPLDAHNERSNHPATTLGARMMPCKSESDEGIHSEGFILAEDLMADQALPAQVVCGSGSLGSGTATALLVERDSMDRESDVAIKRSKVSPAEEENGHKSAVMPCKRTKSRVDVSLRALNALTMSDDAAMDFMMAQGLIRTAVPQCQREGCARDMTLVGQGTAIIWRCPSHKGNKRSLLKDSIFESSHLSHANLVQLLFLWAHQIAVGVASELVQVSDSSVSWWYSKYRHICSRRLASFPRPIGGVGMSVLLDDSLVLIGNSRFMGGYCPQTQQGFLEPFKEQDQYQYTLLRLIQKRVALGSVLYTDKCDVCSVLDRLGGVSPYAVHTLQDTSSFVDPTTGSNGNVVQNFVDKLERRLKTMVSVPRAQLLSHVDEFLWRAQRGRSTEDALRSIIRDVRTQYPFTKRELFLTRPLC